ncbi:MULTISPECIES: MFS transporter [unclassified Paracoccus (in: a-proteobacteria)]|uniref:MFS transporter n=1 Tax=unclassified Paracoccus (in: a-proteobacteria) TaxID=2688777 RepID=UPI0012B22A04|nr:MULTISPECIES: MFS transporter [unclassified Paracoccus (in: a-proteobacteria)]UXU75872.1 MFS transporter [Paracoccus sp. SMMA_5]UXU81782.1 MFS transporter [Paracoccus sp. SMMA_5_TC]
MERRRIWGWWFFDWASQPFATLLTTFIFPVYYAEVARAHFAAQGMTEQAAGAAAQSLWGYGLGISGLVIALLAPVLGALADGSGRRLVWIWIFSGLYVAGSWGLWFLTPDQPNLHLAIACFGIGLIGMEFATIFTNALLPQLAPRDELGRISGSGFAFGYLGGVLALALVLLFLAENAQTGRTLLGIPPILGLEPAAREGTRAAGPFTALWYIAFMIPFALWLRDAPGPRRPMRLRAALADLGRLLAGLPRRRSLAAWLASSMFSRDALNALYSFGGVYAATVLGWPVFLAGVFGVVSAVSAAVISWVGGRADRRWGPRPVIVGCTLVLIAVCVLIIGMNRQQVLGIPLPPGSRLPDMLFFVCGGLIGGAGGALQAASRTMMVRHTRPERAAEAFGLYALSGKATAFLAPLLIAGVTQISGSQRLGILPLIVMFLLALVLLVWVKPQGEAEQ